MKTNREGHATDSLEATFGTFRHTGSPLRMTPCTTCQSGERLGWRTPWPGCPCRRLAVRTAYWRIASSQRLHATQERVIHKLTVVGMVREAMAQHH
jgi:hypothetical protein